MAGEVVHNQVVLIGRKHDKRPAVGGRGLAIDGGQQRAHMLRQIVHERQECLA